MDPWAPINGITLDRYAELSAAVAGETDREKQALLVGQHGVQRPDWDAASAGWQARIVDPALMGQVAQRYWPLYNAALARRQGAPAPHAQQPNYNVQAQDIGNQVGSALNSFGNALGSFVDGAVGAFAAGSRVMVQWSDGNRYPATVAQPPVNGQIEVAFPDGRRIWVPQGVVSAVY